MKKIELLACVVGITVGAGATWFLLPEDDTHFHSDTHPIANPADDEYHVHADFHIVVNDELINLSTDDYMTTAAQQFHPDAHLHDGEGEVKHIHAEDITFAEFLNSLGFTLTDSCLTLDTGNTYCSDETEEVLLFVDGEIYTEPISTYTPIDDDSILLYYGSPTNQNIPAYLEAIPDDSCYYSGTCPERGTAPPESCGLTCEL